MLLHLILGSVALMAGMFAGGFFIVVIGIRRSERGRRLHGGSGDATESFARRLLIRSRGFTDNSEEKGDSQ